ncbi:uncharacterized protein LOC133907546 isoform X1 [Phragmites australis]|uniref:uncharacterized protein LOC133907546 isoform X1 n=1 Tax=Phragmites australis TaxID=29695 RepID=UPI002D76B5AF|nr:uncharacterized protein LOC133907546 isoform X1 [Phragmites australis]
MDRVLWASTPAAALSCGGMRGKGARPSDYSLGMGPLVGQLGEWLCRAVVQPPAPRVCGTPGGPPVTARRVRLSDGRHLAYEESGVPRESARYRIVFSHGFTGSRLDSLRASQKVAEELGVYMVGFDRAGYGESDPNPNRSVRSAALDIEELADALGLGDKFYVVGFSLGCHAVWGALKYIPHRYVHVSHYYLLVRSTTRHVMRDVNVDGMLQARRRCDASASGQLLVDRVPGRVGGGGVRQAGVRRPVGAARVAPRPGDPPLVDGAELAAHLHCRRQHHPAPQQARRRDPPHPHRRRHAPEEEGAGDAARHPRVVLPGHDGDVRQVGVRPDGPAGAAVPGAPVAGRRGRARAGRAAAAHRREAQMGELPRAPRHRPLHVCRPRAWRHRSPDTFRLSRRKGVAASRKYRRVGYRLGLSVLQSRVQ